MTPYDPDAAGSDGVQALGPVPPGSVSEAALVDDHRAVPETVISVRALRVAYGDFEAVRGIDIEVRRGEVFAFLGPNGAGKTTTVEVLEGYLRRSAGEVSVLGAEPEHAGSDWRERVGVVLQESTVEPDLTVRECLSLYAGFYGSPRRVGEIIQLVGLAEKADVLGGALSGGQRRRLDVALALIGDPELVFLDEPTTGFDPSARRSAWDMITGLKALGKTIFLTTHYMEEAEHLADRICVLAAGQIVGEGTPQTLGGRDKAPSEISFTLPAGVERADLPAVVARAITGGADHHVELRSHHPMEVLGALSVWARDGGFDLPDVDVHRPRLEDIYLRLTDGSR
jgi:ABC-2 type transport system ATP-binding protein